MIRLMMHRFDDRKFGIGRTVDGCGIALWFGRRALWLLWGDDFDDDSPADLTPVDYGG